MGYSWSELHRIAYFVACQELSDRARGLVSTYGDANRRSGELVEDASRLVADAQQALRLAVAAERAASTSWEAIGERLDISRQGAHERFAASVQEIADGVLFPSREPAHEGGLGWWACPDGLEDPERTVRRLDEWAYRHRERHDLDRGEHPVSAGLGRRQDLHCLEAIGVVTALATRLIDGDLPDGVSERTARRMLFERKIETYDLMADRAASEHTRRDARSQADDAFRGLVAWHREDLDACLAVERVDPDESDATSFGGGYRFTLGGRPVAFLLFTAEGSAEDTGWFRWSVDAEAYEATPLQMWGWLGESSPLDVAGVDVDELVDLGRREGREAMLTVARDVAARTHPQALIAARDEVLDHLAGDLAKDVAPFQPGGMAGPRPERT